MLIGALVMALAPSQLDAQVGGRAGNRLQGAQARRMQLQHQVVQRFVDQSSRELGLSAEQRGRIGQILLANNNRRQELFEQGVQLRMRLAQGLRNPNTTDDELNRIMNEMVELREREHQMWRQEQQELAATLPPRQRAQLTMRLLRLQERIRQMIDERPGAPVDTSGRTPGANPG
jgi:hypothetical protein